MESLKSKSYDGGLSAKDRGTNSTQAKELDQELEQQAPRQSHSGTETQQADSETAFSVQKEPSDEERSSPAFWRDRFYGCIRKGTEALILAGRVLIDAKKCLPHGEWTPFLMTLDADIGKRTAQKLMKIAGHPAILDPDNLKMHPSSLNALEIFSAFEAEESQSLLDKGAVGSTSTASEIKQLRKPARKPQNKPPEPVHNKSHSPKPVGKESNPPESIRNENEVLDMDDDIKALIKRIETAIRRYPENQMNSFYSGLTSQMHRMRKRILPVNITVLPAINSTEDDWDRVA